MAESTTEKHLTFTLMFILVARASHDPGVGAVDIPFPFRIENTELRSGRYIVRLDKNQLKFTAEDGIEEEVECPAVTAATRTGSACGTLAFIEGGRRYLLCKAFWPSGYSKRAPSDSADESNTRDEDYPFQARIQECSYELQLSP